MELVKKNFGFGCMRLPVIHGEVDIPQTNWNVMIGAERPFIPSVHTKAVDYPAQKARFGTPVREPSSKKVLP